MFTEQAAEHFNHACRADATRHIDGEALARELVDHGEALEFLAAGAGIVDEIVGPHLIRSRGWQRTRACSSDASRWSPPRQLQACATPESIRSMRSHRMALPAQEDAHAPVTMARITSAICRIAASTGASLGAHRVVVQDRAGQPQLASLALEIPHAPSPKQLGPFGPASSPFSAVDLLERLDPPSRARRPCA